MDFMVDWWFSITFPVKIPDSSLFVELLVLYPKNSDTPKICCSHPNIEQGGFNKE